MIFLFSILFWVEYTEIPIMHCGKPWSFMNIVMYIIANSIGGFIFIMVTFVKNDSLENSSFITN